MTGALQHPVGGSAAARGPRDCSLRRVAVVGSTGSIGTQTLDVLRTAPDRFSVSALGAARSFELLAAQAEEFHPGVVAIADSAFERRLADLLPSGIELRAGPGALSSLVETADVVLNAVVGFAGLGVTVATLWQGRRLALANKESLVAGGARGPARTLERRVPSSSRSTPSTVRYTSALPVAALARLPES